MHYTTLFLLSLISILPAFSQGYFLDFAEGDVSGWSGDDYDFSVVDQSLQIAAAGVGPSYQAFSFGFDALDMSENPQVILKIRTEQDVTVRIDLIDANGYVSNSHEVKHAITEDQFQTFTYDFAGKFSQSYPNDAQLDPTQITGILVYFNPGGSIFSGTAYFDDIMIGSVAEAAIALTGNLDFSAVLLDNTKERVASITNFGGIDLNITSTDVPEGFVVTGLAETIPAGSTASFTVAFTPTEEKTYSGNLTINSNATIGESTLALSGEGVTTVPPGELNGLVRVNQVGFYPGQEKLGIVVNGTEGMVYKIRSADLEETLYSGALTNASYWDKSDENVAIADFSDFQDEGTYVLDVPEIGRSYPFKIEKNALNIASQAALRAYYYNRSSFELLPQHAGQWARGAGHLDTNVKVHASGASTERPEGTVISSPGGWYDAGDFGKYIVNGGIAVHTLLASYEAFAPYYDQLDLNIPESANELPDLLDEVLYELDWMLTMQDPNDGGVYHKLTTLNFDGMIMPATATAQRYVYYKSTAAALNFAAVMAQAARVYDAYDTEKSATFLAAAKNAWAWAKANPARYYNQSQVNSTYDPDVTTGEYGDGTVSDEFNWAGIELYITTQDDSYLGDVDLTSFLGTPSWPGTYFLGFASLLNNKDALTAAVSYDDILAKVIGLADNLKSRRESAPYQISHNSFYWGSNSTAGNEGLVLMYAYLHTQNEAYLDAATSIIDYLLGRNATNYSFLTGIGDKQVMNIHHRPSVADGIEAPVPGFIVGGPDGQWAQHDYCEGMTFDTNPAKAFDDVDCSYSMTEVTVNWNAPFVFLAGAMEYLTSAGDYSNINELASPSELTVSSTTASSVMLTWSDNSIGEESYAVERSSDGSTFEVVATLAADAEEYEDSELSPLSTYYYRVKGTAGETSSEYTDVVSATTLNFLIDQSFSIDENKAAGSVVGTVDVELPENFTPVFSILSGNESSIFALNSATGELTSQQALNFETKSSYLLEVQVDDGNGITATATISIAVNDVNETPAIEDAAFDIAENTAAGTGLGTLAASDPDGDNLSYSIVAGNELDAFAVDASSGELTVNDPAGLNFEETPNFSLVVNVADAGGLAHEATVVVTLTDVNEAPKIEAQNFQLEEDAEAGSVFGTIEASDEDGDAVSFQITDGNTEGHFQLDAETGELLLVTEPNDAGDHTLTVEVSDGTLSSSAAIIISIGTPLNTTAENELQVYPNPVIDRLIIKSGIGETWKELSITTVDGKVLFRQDISLTKAQFEIRTDNFPSGVFILHLKNDHRQKTIKIIK